LKAVNFKDREGDERCPITSGETWSVTVREGHRLMVFCNRVLSRIFGPKREDVTRDWRKLHEELSNLYSTPSFTEVFIFL
jgi:hypothetical protein